MFWSIIIKKVLMCSTQMTLCHPLMDDFCQTWRIVCLWADVSSNLLPKCIFNLEFTAFNDFNFFRAPKDSLLNRISGLWQRTKEKHILFEKKFDMNLNNKLVKRLIGRQTLFNGFDFPFCRLIHCCVCESGLNWMS